MRDTCISKLAIQRLQDYDPDFHETIDQQISLQLFVDAQTDSAATIRAKLNVKYVTTSGAPFGTMEFEASSKISAVHIPLNAEGKADLSRAPENVLRLIEGAIAEDMLLPAALAARSMHLPSVLPIPIIFDRRQHPQQQPASAGPQ